MNQIKTEIKQKFGTIAMFQNVAQINKNQMIAFLHNRMSSTTRDQFERVIREKIDTLSPGFVPTNIVTDQEREMIRQFIAINYKSIRSFCKSHPEFSVTFVSNIITGRKKTKEKRWFSLLASFQNEAKAQVEVNQN